MSSAKQVCFCSLFIFHLYLGVENCQSGFNYQFDALEAKGQPNELNQVFTELFHSPHANRIAGFRLAQGIAPILRLMVHIRYLILQWPAYEAPSRSLGPAGRFFWQRATRCTLSGNGLFQRVKLISRPPKGRRLWVRDATCCPSF